MAAPWEAYQETKTETSKQEGPWAKFSEEKPLAEKPFIERQKTAISPVTDVLNRALVAQTIGAPVDIATMAMRPFGYKTEVPVGGSEWIGKQMEKAGFVTPTRRPVAELITGLSPLGVPAAKGIAGLAKKSIDYYKTSKGAEAEELAKALKTQLTGKAEEVITGAERAQAAPGKRLEEIAKAQRELGAREPVAAARQVAREKEAETALNKLSPQRNILAEDVGSIIQPEARKNLEQLRGTRQEESITKIKDPAFESARNRESAGDFISTNPKSADQFSNVVGEIEQQIARTPEPYGSELRRRLASIRGKEVPMTDAEIRAAELRSSITGEPVSTTKVEPMTMDQAEFLRRMLKSKDLGKVEGFAAQDPFRMNALGDKLFDAMKAYEPRIGQYVEKYKETSAPISKALAGRGRALTDVELIEAENVLFSADKTAAAKYYLNGSQERAQALITVTGGKKPEVINGIKGYFRNQLAPMTSKQAQQFVANQEGFLREFPELRKPLNDIVDTKRVSETAGVSAQKRAEAATTRLAGEAKPIEKTISEQREISNRYRIFQNKITSQTPKDTVTDAKSMINRLRQDGLINDVSHRNLLNKIEQIKLQYGETEKAKQNIQLLLRKSLIYSGMGAGGIVGYYGLKALGE